MTRSRPLPLKPPKGPKQLSLFANVGPETDTGAACRDDGMVASPARTGGVSDPALTLDPVVAVTRTDLQAPKQPWTKGPRHD